MNDTLTFGQWVKLRRKALDLTRQDLAQFVGCSASAIVKIETGVRRPSRQIAERLLRYLDVPPEEHQAFLSLARTDPHAAEQRPTPPSSHPTNLPARVTSLIGREAEIASVRNLVLGPSRMVTLTGPGGVGKTRLAIEVAAELLYAFEHGVFFVPLALISDPDLMPSTVAQALGVKETAGRPLLEGLKERLASNNMLLVLDNFEQVVAAAPVLAELLGAAPDLRLLVTSRAVLHVYGEQQYIVPPLGMPPQAQLGNPAPSNLAEYEAVRLFIERARLVKADFSANRDPAQVQAIAGICHRLDGLPLAIELAAARVNIFSPKAMLVRLGSRLKLLTAGALDLPPRQQTLRNAIDWSYELLGESDKRLFRRLAVFVGGRGLDAIELVCNAGGGVSANVLEGVESLVDKSLLQQSDEAEDEPRFWMLETIQEYALDRLDESGEAGEIKGRHAGYYLDLAEEAEPQLAGAEQARWLARLDGEHDNLRAALRWARETGRAETALRMAGALWRFWLVYGYYTEGREHLAAALRLAGVDGGRAHPQAYAKALNGAAIMAWRQNSYEAARSLSLQSLEIYRELGDKHGIAQSLNNLGNVAHRHGDYPQAQAYFGESLAVRRELGDARGVADSLNNLAMVVDEQGDYAAARLLYEESLALRRGLGDQRGIANSLNNIGLVAWEHSDLGQARSLLGESLEIYRELGDKRGIANSLNNIGLVAWEQADYGAAARLYTESLERYLDLQDVQGVTDGLEGLARVAGAQGMAERAARLWGAAEALREAIGIDIPPGDQAEYEQNVSAARALLDPPMWEAAWASGRAMSQEQAVACALDEAEI